MKNIIDYCTVFNLPHKMVEDVQRFIKLGWQPLGGISVVEEMKSGNVYFGQAMVKYEPDLSMEITARGDMSSLGGKKWKKVS